MQLILVMQHILKLFLWLYCVTEFQNIVLPFRRVVKRDQKNNYIKSVRKRVFLGLNGDPKLRNAHGKKNRFHVEGFVGWEEDNSETENILYLLARFLNLRFMRKVGEG